MAVVTAIIVDVHWPVFERCQSLLYPFSQNICQGTTYKSKEKHELIEQQ